MLALSATSASSANIGRTHGMNPVAIPRTSTATIPWPVPGRARRASTTSSTPTSAQKLYVETIEPLNHDTGVDATSTAAAMPTHRSTSSVPATAVRVAAAAEASAARRTRLRTVSRPVTTCSACAKAT